MTTTDQALVRNRRRNYRLTIFWMMLPAILGLAMFQYGPLVVAVRNGFFDMTLLNPERAKFIGWANYIKMAQDARFWQSLRNTAIYSGGKVLLELPFALILAVLSQQAIKGIGIVRTAVFAPTVTAMSTMAVIWNMMYHPQNGLFNSILTGVGIPPQPFLTSASQAMASILVLSLWKDVGSSMLILLGGLQAIPEEFYEASSIDGAGPWEQTRYITLPLLRRTLLYAMVLLTVTSFKVFTPIYVMTKGGPLGVTRTTVYYVYELGFKYLQMGYASAVSVILMIVMIVVAMLQNRLLRTEFEY